ncbi:MAG: MG2 domain-containing protein, partial [Thermoanaerobaculia bacterium]
MRLAPRRLSFFGLGAAALAAAGAIALARPGKPLTGDTPTWKEVERLVSEQKFEEASKKTAELREAARKAGDAAEVTRALIREVQLRIGLHGYETAVRFLKDEAWPKSTLSRAALNLFYGRSLVTYAQAYGWEIGQREKVESKGGVDLKAWTKEQIHAEAARAYVEVWKDREALGAEPLKSLAEYLDPNNYPAGIRGTLRDAATYLFVELLADTSGWRPEQSNELFGLDVAALAKGDPSLARAVRLDNPAVHPLVRIGALLDDLEAWHTGRGEREAALETRLERLRRLHDSFTESADRRGLRRELSRRLAGYRDVPWWAEGQAVLAGFVQADDRPGNLVRARALALEGARAYPDSIGGQRCRSFVASIERPDYQIVSMSSDGTGRRSIEVTHRNLPALHFRAYALDLVKRVESVRNYNLLPAGNELEDLLKRAPAATWETALPATPDYKNHRTFVTPSVTAPGLYAVVASARSDFGSGNNRLRAVTIIVTGLVLVTRQTEEGGLEVRALAGMSGKPVPGAAIDLYRYDWQKGHQKTATATSGPDGLVRFTPGSHQGQTLFVIGHSGADLALDPHYMYLHPRSAPSDATSSLVFTDRSVYRPLQKIFWKVVVYQGNGEKARYRTLAESSVTVSLVDPNGQMVDSAAAKMNAYGSAAGEFTVPTGRLLGGWRVQSSLSGAAYVRIEEYKRPTFEATFKEPKDPLRLNKSATLRGEAR